MKLNQKTKRFISLLMSFILTSSFVTANANTGVFVNDETNLTNDNIVEITSGAAVNVNDETITGSSLNQPKGNYFANSNNVNNVNSYYYNGNKYEIIDEIKTWDDAKEHCESLGGHLLTITSEAEQDYIVNILTANAQTTNYWIGGTDEETEGEWKWITGEPFVYTNWATNEPNNLGNEDYLQLYVSNNRIGKWNDTKKEMKYGFICEWENIGINSISPVNNSSLSSNPTFTISASDTENLSECSVYYKAVDSSDWSLIETKTLSSPYELISVNWDTSNVISGTYSIKVFMKNSTGVEYTNTYTYTLYNDIPTQAVLTGTAGDLAANLSWTNADNDISYYKIYRNRTGENFRYIGKVESTNYTDANLSSEISYNYYVVSVNQYGNSSMSNIVTVTPNFVDTITPSANAGFDVSAVVNEPVAFIGEYSTDNVAIASYLWDFGDGTTSTEVNPSHIYTAVKDAANEDYDYTATLTVTDTSGNTATSAITVSVYPSTQIGKLKLTVTDSSNNILPDSIVYVDFADSNNKKFVSDADGIATITAMAGNYDIYVYKAGYIPKHINLAVEQYKTLSEKVQLKKGDIATADTSIKRMNLQEISDAGIDITAPENQYVYSIETTLVFEERKIHLPKMIINGAAQIHDGSGGPSGGEPFHVKGGGYGNGYYVYPKAIPAKIPEKEPILVYLIIPADISWLKEFFNVSMIIDNKASEMFELSETTVTLELPDGLSLAPTLEGQSETIDIGSIQGGTSKNINWIVRGDTAGEYDVNAHFESILLPFEESVDLDFTTSEKIQVIAENAVRMYISADSKAYIGAEYHVRFTLKNVSNIPLYNLSFNFGMEGETEYTHQSYKLVNIDDQEYLPYLVSGNQIEITEFPAGGTISGVYTTIFDAPGDPSEVYYQLIETIVSNPDGDAAAIHTTVTINDDESGLIGNAVGAEVDSYRAGTLIGQKTSNFDIIYSSVENAASEFGNGWTHPYNYLLYEDANRNINLRFPNGQSYAFLPNYQVSSDDDSVIINSANSNLTSYKPITRGSTGYVLNKISNGYTVTMPDKSVLEFKDNRTSGYKLVSCKDKTGYQISITDTLTSKTITEKNTGESIVLNYNNKGLVENVVSSLGTTYYQYDENNNLINATNNSNRENTFEYTNGRMTKKQETKFDSDNNVVSNQMTDRYSCTYDDKGRLLTETDAKGNTTSYSYDENTFWRLKITKTDRTGATSVKEYNRFGELVSSTDELGNKTVYTYDGNGNNTSIIDPLENTCIYEYNALNKVTKYIDAEGINTLYEYDTNGNLTKKTNAMGGKVTYTYSNNRVSSVTDENGNITEYTYDTNGNILKTKVLSPDKTKSYIETNTYSDCRLATSKDYNGNITYYNYNANGQVQSVTNALNNTTYYEYDANGRTIKVTYPDNTTEKYIYSPYGDLWDYTDRNNNRTMYGYDQNHNLTSSSVVKPIGGIIYGYIYDAEDRQTSVNRAIGGGGQPNGSSITEYNADGSVSAQTDYNGNRTEYTYDESGRLTTEKYATGTTSYTYYKTGRRMTETDAYGGQTKYFYDNNWNLVKETNALGNSTVYTYDNKGAVTSVKTPLSNKTQYEYDFMGNQTAVVDAKDNRTEYTYDGNGNVTSVKNALEKTAYYSYDALNRTVSETDFNGKTTTYLYNDTANTQTVITPNGVSTTTKYDGNGNAVQVKDTNDVVVQTAEYDFNNKPTKITDALNNYVTYNYNGIGNPVSYTTARGNTYSYTYDGNGNLLTETDPLNGVVSYEYNEFNTASSFTDANENETQYSYDLLNRLTSETDAIGNSDSYSYDAISRLTEYNNKRGQNISYSYDVDNRKIARTTVEGGTAYTYDKNNNLLTVSDENGTITREYDELNRIVSYTNTAGQTIEYDYDDQGNLTRLTYPDGKVVVYGYNDDNQLVSVRDWNNRVTAYTYDENGRLKTISRPDGSVETYTYNVAGQLTVAEDKKSSGEIINRYGYSYDADGNIKTENSINEPNVNDISINSADMSYSTANRLTNFNGTAIPYDADGNALKTPLGNEFGNLTYDSLNQLTDVTISGSAISYSYTYDAEGYRIAKNENGITTTFVTDPNAELSRVLMSTTNGETTYYVYGLGLISQETGTNYRLYHYDYRGSTTALTTLDGNVTDTVYYDPYGTVISRTGTTETPFLYVGKYGVETDSNGLYYMRARYYNPQIQRFINVDPIRDGYNWYGYVDGNPLSLIDPNGLTSQQKAEQIIRDNKQNILDAGVKFGVNPAIIASCIYTEQTLNVDWKDKYLDPLAAQMGINVSLGIGQVRQSTARKVEDAGLMPKIESSNQIYYPDEYGNVMMLSAEDISRSSALMADKTNVEYVAAYLKLIQDLWKPVYPEIDGKSDILGTLYNLGELGGAKKGPHKNPQSNDFGREVKKNYPKMQQILGIK